MSHRVLNSGVQKPSKKASGRRHGRTPSDLMARFIAMPPSLRIQNSIPQSKDTPPQSNNTIHQSSNGIQIAPRTSLTNFLLPLPHPFISTEKRLRKKQSTQETLASDSPEEITTRLIVSRKELKLAKDCGYFDTDYEAAHADDGQRHMIGAFYARYHDFDDDEKALLIPKRHASKSVSRYADRGAIMRWRSRFQTQIMAIYLEGMKLVIEKMGGLTLWRLTTRQERLAVYRRLCDFDPPGVTMACLGPVAKYVPVANIFSDNTPLHVKWQRFHRTIFVWTCEHVFFERLATDEDNCRKCFNSWRNMVNTQDFQLLNLGSHLEIPVKHNLDLDHGWIQGKQQIDNLPELGVEVPEDNTEVDDDDDSTTLF